MTPRLTAVVLGFAFLAAMLDLVAAQCPIIQTGTGSINLNKIAPQILTLKERYENYTREDEYLWPVSFCNASAVPVPAHLEHACSEPGFLQEFDKEKVECQNSFSVQLLNWTWNGESVSSAFADHYGGVAFVEIRCKATNRIRQNGPILVNRVNGTLTWMIYLESVDACPSGSEIKPPVLPVNFYGEFVEYTAPMTHPPPYYNGVPAAPFKATRGRMYYDWRIKSMIEVRLDYCVNIFDFSNDFSCVFFNVNATSYLISNGTTNLPSCCVFGQPWYPPPPNFLRDGNVTVNEPAYKDWDCEVNNWYELPSIQPPTGPFWFSFRNETWDTQVYHSFSFPGMEGWVQQNFFDIHREEPPSSTWDLPKQCHGNIPNCGFFGVDSTRHPWSRFQPV